MINKKLEFFRKNIWVIVLLILIFAFLSRIWRLKVIGDLIFDEVYFVKFAQNYLQGVSFFDIHPPLGKLIIALGLKMFGDTSFTWRIMPAIFGTLLILAGYFVGKELSSRIAGLFVAIILTLDGMILVYSRTGLIDIFLIFFILLGFYFILKYSHSPKLSYLIFAGISLGLASSVKYIGWLLIFVYFFVILINKRLNKHNFWQFLVFLVILPLIIYLSFFLFSFGLNNFFGQVLEWHEQSFNYNLTLTEGHPYGSKWWGWFILWRPIWLYFKDANGQFVGVDGIGNPILWWSSVAVVPLLIWNALKGRKNDLIILFSFLLFWLFWSPFNRVLFYYHALTSFTFLILGLALILERLYQNYKYHYLVLVFFGLAFLMFVFFLPIWIGFPLDSKQFYWRIWFKGWI